MQVSFIGLGIMGSRMAHNLLKNGVQLTIFNRTISATKSLEAAGATVASSVEEAVTDADVVFTMLSTPEVVETVMLGPGGGLAHMRPESLWLDCSTVNPSFSRQTSDAAKVRQIRFMDAPVAGTKPHAENAQLTFFIGGSSEDLAEVKSLLEHMSQKVIHVGALGMGASFKMLVNSLLAQSMLMFSETVLLGEKMGLDKDFLLNTLPNLVVSAPFTKFKAEMMRSDSYEVQFPLE
ncbi:MAG: NAD(P)-dependent oxidoreductase, partial [Bacteroidota bacterium]